MSIRSRGLVKPKLKMSGSEISLFVELYAGITGLSEQCDSVQREGVMGLTQPDAVLSAGCGGLSANRREPP